MTKFVNYSQTEHIYIKIINESLCIHSFHFGVGDVDVVDGPVYWFILG